MTNRRLSALMTAAERDIEAARRLLPEMPDQAIFHAQQAAEKMTRAVCEGEGLAVGRTHNIGQAAAPFPTAMFSRRIFWASTICRRQPRRGATPAPAAGSRPCPIRAMSRPHWPTSRRCCPRSATGCPNDNRGRSSS